MATKKAEVVAVIGIAVPVVINLAFVLATVLLGNLRLSLFPTIMIDMLKTCAPPAIFVAVFMMFSLNIKPPQHWVTAVVAAIVVVLLPISPGMLTIAAGDLNIVVSIAVALVTRGPQAA